ncbi:MAG: InlB B-repeat-containing protein [Firmicutes bacterium]|nr:InlB B-repeat-containing protein [Bacillota bacterium]
MIKTFSTRLFKALFVIVFIAFTVLAGVGLTLSSSQRSTTAGAMSATIGIVYFLNGGVIRNTAFERQHDRADFTMSGAMLSRDFTHTLQYARREGYVLQGWYRYATLSGQRYSPRADFSGRDVVNLYARWLPANQATSTHGVEFVLNGGTLDGQTGTVRKITPTNFPVALETFRLGFPTQAGRHFLGWYRSHNFEGQRYYHGHSFSQNPSTARITTFFARWGIGEIPIVDDLIYVIFHLHGGTISEPFSHTFAPSDGGYFFLPNATRSGYSLRSWLAISSSTNLPQIRRNVGNIAKSTLMHSLSYNKIHLHAEWERLPDRGYSVVRFFAKGEEFHSLVVFHGITPILPAPPTISNYSFQGWYLNNSFTQRVPDNLNITNDINIYARMVSLDEINNQNSNNGDYENGSNIRDFISEHWWILVVGGVILLLFIFRKKIFK